MSICVAILLLLHYKKMKVNVHCSIEAEIVAKLRKLDNYSALIEKLLTDYYKELKPSDEKIKQKLKEIKQKKEEIKSLKQDIKQISTIKALDDTILKQKDAIGFKNQVKLWFYDKQNVQNNIENMKKGNYKDIYEYYKAVKGGA